ncbi:DUF4377 domain-containing protein [Larkinella insperata]|uniref:DUF4377 domain-containing protein n=1 Tax=Larkinella insperata TaxID=332158 RepID=A0ABW3Q5N2_9BACT|nr:DUF4377 domain-containing protein [Larkinella insperata]
MNRYLYFFALGFLLLFASCDTDGLKPETMTMWVADRQVDCTGVGPQKCLLVKMEGDTSWTYHYSGIEDFTHEAGYEYRLTVRRKKIKNPPADGSSMRYSLVKIEEKIKK